MTVLGGEPFVVTEAFLDGRWNGYRDGRSCRCHLCGEFLALGTKARWIYANGSDTPTHCGNFFVCETCDGPDVYERAAKHEDDMQKRAWWLMDRAFAPPHPEKSHKRKSRR